MIVIFRIDCIMKYKYPLNVIFMKIRFSFLLIIFSISNIVLCNEVQEKLKMYVFYTPSHQVLLEEWFLPSLKAYDDYEVIIELHPQECPSGDFHAPGWIDTMKRKVDLIIRAINENWDKVFVHADVDIQFFGPTQNLIRELMQYNDLLCQRDKPDSPALPRGVLCAGFFACRGNEKTLQLWQLIKEKISNQNNDQRLLNDFVVKQNMMKIRWGYLPTSKFWGPGTFNPKLFWCPGMPLSVPEGTLMHHANFTVGVKNKIAQLQYVRNVINGRKK